ncbi:hypothetical protein CW707_01070 [Candidatus Bathyarchaeota archaeon]|nr:MAG: hypothetical protein CW707_01070 [Candidatus Bathyarchaeota archaeon]
MPSRLRAPTAIIHTAPLKGVVAPPRFVPRTSADQTAEELKPEKPCNFIIGEKVRATAILLTIVLAIPLNQRVESVAFKELCPNV